MDSRIIYFYLLELHSTAVAYAYPTHTELHLTFWHMNSMVYSMVTM